LVSSPTSWTPIVSDENGRKQTKNPISTSISIFFWRKMGSGSENAGLEAESGYADAWKRTNTDGEPEN
jgi:hypothetical protein